MYVSKGGFAGKTCALAKLNDSFGGKRSKRLSKEERKGMVETFIKRHQASNNGNFPSLYLTHKEVGGSYYTVREIFRDLIQENRVLASPKLPPGDQNMENLDSFLENNPLGTISFDPNVHGLPPKDNQTLVNEYESRREKALNSKWIFEIQNLGKDDLVNGSSHATIKNEEFVEHKHIESCEGQIRHLTDEVVIENFPLRPVFSVVHNVDEKTIEKEVLVVDTKLDEELSTPLQESTDENILRIMSRGSHWKRPLYSYGVEASSSQYLGRSHNSSSSYQILTFEEITANKNESQMQPSGTFQMQTSATLNRTNFDSCEEAAAASKKPISEEANPLLLFMKTIVAAFVKFWSE